MVLNSLLLEQESNYHANEYNLLISVRLSFLDPCPTAISRGQLLRISLETELFGEIISHPKYDPLDSPVQCSCSIPRPVIFTAEIAENAEDEDSVFFAFLSADT